MPVRVSVTVGGVTRAVGASALTDFRSYADADARRSTDGLTAVVGANGQGKTNLLEAHRLPGHARVVPRRARRGAGARAPTGRSCGPRSCTPTGASCWSRRSCRRAGRNRVQVNRQRLARARDLLGVLRVSVFSPDDLALVKGGPAERRRYLDETLVALHPKHDALRADLERDPAPAQHAAEAGRRAADARGRADTRRVGRQAGRRRRGARRRRAPTLVDRARARWSAKAYAGIAGEPPRACAATTSRPGARRVWPRRWPPAATDDLRRAVDAGGSAPRRLDLASPACRPAPTRPRASSGRSRFALRLAAHQRRDRASSARRRVLLLDDVFSELDPDRGDALRRPSARRPDRAHHRRAAAARRPRPAAHRRSCAATWRRLPTMADDEPAHRSARASTSCVRAPAGRRCRRPPRAVFGRLGRRRRHRSRRPRPARRSSTRRARRGGRRARLGDPAALPRGRARWSGWRRSRAPARCVIEVRVQAAAERAVRCADFVTPLWYTA